MPYGKKDPLGKLMRPSVKLEGQWPYGYMDYGWDGWRASELVDTRYYLDKYKTNIRIK